MGNNSIVDTKYNLLIRGVVAKELDQQQPKYIFFFHLPLQIPTIVNWEPLKVTMISWMFYSTLFQKY